MSRKKKDEIISVENYIQTFCLEKRIRRRRTIYVSEETHSTLRKLVSMFKYEQFTTTSSLAEAIFCNHFDIYGDMLNNFRNAQQKEERSLRVRSEGSCQDEEAEDDQ